MSIEILMPFLSPTMKDGTLANWFVKEGDVVKSGSIIAEIETDKAIMELESFDSGIMGKIVVPAGTQNIPVGSLIGVLLEKDEDLSVLNRYNVKKFDVADSSDDDCEYEDEKDDDYEDEEEELAEEVIHKLEDVFGKDHIHIVSNDDIIKKDGLFDNVQQDKNYNFGDRKFISPVAKRMASDANIDISSVAGTGPNGRVIKSDIERFLSDNNKVLNETKVVEKDLVVKKPTSLKDNNLYNDVSVQNDVTFVPHTKMRSVIADRLLQSKTQSPHFYLSVECNVSSLVKMRKDMNETICCNDQKDTHISINDLIVKAASIALVANPELNASWRDDGIILYPNIDISIAVSVANGIITPIIKNVNKLGLIDLSLKTKDLIKKAKDGKLKPDEFQGGTFSISNLGMFGIREFYPIINPPQAAILSIGATEKKPVVDSFGNIVIGDVCVLGLSVDHRIVDGLVAAKYLKYLKNILENPIMLSL